MSREAPNFPTLWMVSPCASTVAAKDYWSKGFVRRFFSVTVFNALLIDRQKQATEDDPIEQMVSVLDQDESLIIFPEGTRGSGEEIAPFRAGLYHIGEMRSAVELVPVHLENLNRILPPDLNARIDLTALDIPAIFRTLREKGDLADADMMRTFNMGAGMALVVAPEAVAETLAHLEAKDCRAYRIGEIIPGKKKVEFQGALAW